jgi:hypothetical protein
MAVAAALGLLILISLLLYVSQPEAQTMAPLTASSAASGAMNGKSAVIADQATEANNSFAPEESDLQVVHKTTLQQTDSQGSFAAPERQRTEPRQTVERAEPPIVLTDSVTNVVPLLPAGTVLATALGGNNLVATTATATTPASAAVTPDPAVIARMQNDFIQALGPQDPTDPNYLDRWLAATSLSDAQYRLFYGDIAYMRMQEQIVQQEIMDGQQ